MKGGYRLAAVNSHPIQYFAPVYRALAAHPQIELKVYYASDHGLSPDKIDPGFGRAFAWDVPLLDGYDHLFLRNSRPGTGVDDWRLDAPDLGDHLSAGGFDAVLVNGWDRKLYWQAVYHARRRGIPVIMRGDSNLQGRRSWPIRAAKTILFPALFCFVDAFLAVGSLNRELYEHFGVPAKKIFHAPHCVDNKYFADLSVSRKEEAAGLRRELGLSTGQSLLLFVGKLMPYKRPVDLLEALSGIEEAARPSLVMVGDGPLLQQCREVARERGLRRVHFAGFKNQSELPLYYAAADTLILPSDDRETWGLVVNEGMACGLPAIVSSSCGCAPDLIIPGLTGFIYPVGDTACLRDCIKKIISEPALLAAMKGNAACHIERFSVDKTVAAILTVLARLRYSTGRAGTACDGGETGG